MKAIILAAGRGSRMGEATAELPKCRTVLHGKELLTWQLEALRGAGMESIALVRGYRAESFDQPLHYFDNPRWAETNMVATLSCATDWLASSPCIISYSDIAYQPASVRRLVAHDADIAITYDPRWLDLWRVRFDDPLADAESFRIADGRVTEIGARCDDVAQIEGQFMGLIRLTPSGWQRLCDVRAVLDEHTRDRLDMTGLLSRAIAAGVRIDGVPIDEPWCEVDSQSDLDRLQAVPMWQWQQAEHVTDANGT